MAIDVNSIVYSPPHLSFSSEPCVYFNKRIIHKGEVVKILAFVPGSNGRQPKVRVLDLKYGKEKLITEVPMLGSSFEDFYVALIESKKLKTGRSYVVRVASQEKQATALISEQICTLLTVNAYYRFYLDLFGNPTNWDWAHFWDTISPTETGVLLSGIPLDALASILPKRGPLDGRILYEILGPLITLFMARDMEHLPFSLEYASRPITGRLPHIDLTKVMWLLINLAPCWADICFFYRNARIDYGVQENELYMHFELANPYIEKSHPHYHSYVRRFLAVNYPNALTALVSDIVSSRLLFKMDWSELEFSVMSFQTPATTTFS